MTTAYLATAYLAPVSYYCKLVAYPSVVIETHENYPKQTYRNRCLIAGANGILPLSIPVEKQTNGKCPTKDIRISDHGHWRRQHWRSLVAAYRGSPFFQYFQDDFAPFYDRRYAFLLDLNQDFQEMICTLLDIRPAFRCSTHYEATVPNDFRQSIRPRRPPRDDTFRPQPYTQVFAARNGFLPCLSIVDLLFNLGAEAVSVLKNSISEENNPVQKIRE